MNQQAQTASAPSSVTGYLPDLCGIRPLVATLLVAQMLAFVLHLAPQATGSTVSTWSRLGLISLFVHWVCLSSLVCLCLARKALSKLKPIQAGLISYAIILFITFALSALVAKLGGGLFAQATTVNVWLFAIKNTVIAAIVSAIALRILYLQYVQKRIDEARSSARVQALQARIRPHFLFNSMNTIAALIHQDPQQAERAVEDLSEIFRASLMDEGRLVTLADELASVKKYLHMESHRLGERLRLDWQIDEVPANAYLPPLVLQPLLENAVYYGIEPVAEGGTIRIQVKPNHPFVELIIENPNHAAISAKKGKGHHIALDNIKERLKFYFGKSGQVYMVEQDNLMRVILTFPVQETQV